MDVYLSMPLPFSAQFLDPWQTPSSLLHERGGNLSPLFKGLLLWDGSLTQRLEEMFNHPVAVRVDGQIFVPEWLQEPEIWGSDSLPPTKNGILLRDAWLIAGNGFRVFAHSQLSVDKLAQANIQAIQRGAQPLGYLFLEQNDRMERKQLALCRITMPNPEKSIDKTDMAVFWCRRSLFHVNGNLRARILEIFLTTDT